MTWPPSRATFLLALAVGTAGWFVVGTLLGAKPDGSILGFSAAIWAAWDNELIQQRRQRSVRRRKEHRDAEAESEDDDQEPKTTRGQHR